MIGIGGDECAAGTEGGIAHEFLHALGFNHAHQSPPSRSYIRRWATNLSATSKQIITGCINTIQRP
ncbi:MAG: hypothetical protein EOS75_30065 [Mesorhizobium sp.]|nr:MAG: hypothetical protein EOS74_10740 [Mesorhizobium sp.]RWD52242.1 MAG: hypothetical protein EOS75_30065 [Mesorhizobium sp.]